MKLFAIILCLWAGVTEAACRQALVLALDVSGSVDDAEYRMQRDGLADALVSDAVRKVLVDRGTAPVDITVFEWSGPTHQVIVQPWISIADAATLGQVANRIRTAPRIKGVLTTAIGSAMRHARDLLQEKKHCWRRTVDISGDGEANTGPRPQDVNDIPDSIIINGLVIGAGDQFNRDERVANVKELSAYFNSYVIRGTDAFVEVALGFEDYANAMERKLLRELQSVALGQAPNNQTITKGLPLYEMPRQRPLWIKPR